MRSRKFKFCAVFTGKHQNEPLKYYAQFNEVSSLVVNRMLYLYFMFILKQIVYMKAVSFTVKSSANFIYFFYFFINAK